MAPVPRPCPSRPGGHTVGSGLGCGHVPAVRGDATGCWRGVSGRFLNDVGRVTQPRGTTVGPSTNVVESSGSVHGMEGPRCVILKITSSDVGTGAPSRSVLVSWRSQPSGLVPTTSVGELNLIGEPKNPSVVHPPHSTVLRREEGKGIHIQLTDRNNIISLLDFYVKELFYILSFHHAFCSYIESCFAEVTTWPRMDNDPPGSWNGVVQTPLRKLWVQCQRVATSMSKVQDLLVGYPRAPFASVVTHSVEPSLTTHTCETQCRLLTASLSIRGTGLRRDGR